MNVLPISNIYQKNLQVAPKIFQNINFERRITIKDSSDNNSNKFFVVQKIYHIDNENDIQRILSMMSSACSSVIISDNPNIIHKVLDDIANETKNIPNKSSFGFFHVPNNKLKIYAPKFDPKTYTGWFIGVGDKTGPVNVWTKAYCSKLVILPKDVFNIL